MTNSSSNLQQDFIALKLAPPVLQRHDLFRMRVVQHLNEGASRKITLITAPEGYGKTTVASQWASQAVQKVAWLSLDRNDNDPGKFLKNLIASLQTVNHSIGKGIFESLQSPDKPTMEVALKRMLDQIGMELNDFVLVLDDYHVIESPPVFNILSFIKDYLPPQMHLFIIGETEPPLSVSSLRASDQLKEVRTPYLSFTTEEAQALFNNVMKLEVPYGDITALVHRSNAWPTAIKYAALCLQNAENLTEFVADYEKNEDDPMVYLTDALLKAQDAEVGDFLSQISILDCFNASLCNAVTGRSDSGEILKSLAERGAFLFPLSRETPWYCLHTPARKILFAALEKDQAETISYLNLRAALRCAQKGLIMPAFQYALNAKNFNFASELIESHSQHMLQEGELVTVSTWLNSIPEAIIKGRPMLSICRAWVALILQKMDDVETHLETAAKASQQAANADEIAAHIDAIRGYLTAKS